MSKRQIVIPPDEPDDYDPKREPILQPGMLWAVLYWVVFFLLMAAAHKATQWVIVDMLGWFPRR